MTSEVPFRKKNNRNVAFKTRKSCLVRLLDRIKIRDWKNSINLLVVNLLGYFRVQLRNKTTLIEKS